MTLPFEAARISPKRLNRRSFIGGSDARVIMGSDEAALLRLWREKRGEAEPEDLSENLMPQLQHNMWVMNTKAAVLSIITGGGKWVEIKISADPLYQHLLLTAEKKFWRCVENGEPPRLFGIEPPRPRIEALQIIDMSSSNSWAEFAALFRNTREAFLDHERAKSELKSLMPEDVKEAIGHGVRGKRSKSGAVSFDVLTTEAPHAPVQ